MFSSRRDNRRSTSTPRHCLPCRARRTARRRSGIAPLNTYPGGSPCQGRSPRRSSRAELRERLLSKGTFDHRCRRRHSLIRLRRANVCRRMRSRPFGLNGVDAVDGMTVFSRFVPVTVAASVRRLAFACGNADPIGLDGHFHGVDLERIDPSIDDGALIVVAVGRAELECAAGDRNHHAVEGERRNVGGGSGCHGHRQRRRRCLLGYVAGGVTQITGSSRSHVR